MKKTRNVMGIVFTPKEDIQNFVEEKGFNFLYVLPFSSLFYDIKEGKKVLTEKDVVFVDGLGTLVDIKDKLVLPPFLTDSMSVLLKLKKSKLVSFLDCKVHSSGLVEFFGFKRKKILSFLSKRFTPDKFIIRFDFPYIPKKVSILTTEINNFLSTLPFVVHEAFLLVFTLSIKTKDFSFFNFFIDKNRLVTVVNKKQFFSFVDTFESLKDDIFLIIDKGKESLKGKDENFKLLYQDVKFLLKFYGNENKLKSFLDEEKGFVYQK